MESVFKCTGYKKHTYKNKNTGSDASLITFYGMRDFNDFEASDECYGVACESKTLFDSDFDLIPNGYFEINKKYIIRSRSIQGREYIMSIKAVD